MRFRLSNNRAGWQPLKDSVPYEGSLATASPVPRSRSLYREMERRWMYEYM